ncbi:ABC transporter substrate-binding protein [Sporomusa sphaeroides]|uniref:High-affinity heme uptake system protein IsdE n=2 Tax=Sporomusa TaxID=2375 RepID=A0ABM9W273_9FIRM|nr:helical backbone metal receptor [Sporomusa sphaeroides]MCM0758552.1 helical backbone metal receptor [Sporomusa sphaeroides DSM 2875]OLS56086.1 high-affinity heme uptake system protein IsdE precursor [Sporomusa sphaeroides DSM 2875]CVK19272.1 High-affinity heme uptake system protein IsdE precursor [Sporomusa sphaeroides DSM 2875]SCM82666.1 ABC-type transporter, periplasmic subunit [uncultured Sporomusa sp.]HML33476.1 helical backbone metal receptor [Sporomusa sphaeroides]
MKTQPTTGKVNTAGFSECRCPNCNRLLFKGRVKYVEIQCPKCRLVQTIKKGRSLRLVALNPSNVDLYYAAGGQLIGRPSTTALPSDLLEKIKDVPEVGETPCPNIDQIIALKPDLVLAADTHVKQPTLSTLEKAGIPVYRQRLDSFQEISQALRFYGELADRPGQANEVIDRLDSKLQQAQERSKNKPSPRVLTVWGSLEKLYMALPNSFTGDLISRLNALNVAGDSDNPATQYAPLTLEFALQADPDLILLINHSDEAKVGDKIRNELMLHPAWQKLKAVQQNQVYQLPYQLFAVNPASRADMAIDFLSNLFYPEPHY